jgi:hypothetical protein
MPWYRIYCDSGPGHQSHHEFYRWYDNKLTEVQRKEEWEEAFSGRDWPIGDMKLLSALPGDVKQAQIESAERQIADIPIRLRKIADFLRVLEKTKVKGCAHRNTLFIPRVNADSFYHCKFCGKVRMTGEKNWKKIPKPLKLFLIERKLDRK